MNWAGGVQNLWDKLGMHTPYLAKFNYEYKGSLEDAVLNDR